MQTNDCYGIVARMNAEIETLKALVELSYEMFNSQQIYFRARKLGFSSDAVKAALDRSKELERKYKEAYNAWKVENSSNQLSIF